MTPVLYIKFCEPDYMANKYSFVETISQNKRKCNNFITGCLDLVSCKTFGNHLMNIYDLLKI